jgi:integrase
MEETMARRRYQRGSLTLRGERHPVWTARWREDVIDEHGRPVRVYKREVLGTLKDFPTQKLALRELEHRVSHVNRDDYSAARVVTFAAFAKEWQEKVMTQYKPSSQKAFRSQLRSKIVPFFGPYKVREITPRVVQAFIQACVEQVSGNTTRKHLLLLKMMWRQARAWGYALQSPFEGIIKPRVERFEQPYFKEQDAERILRAAGEPEKTIFWVAMETGMRPGELFGLRVQDLDLPNLRIAIRQSIWNQVVSTPKTSNGVRDFALSPQLVAHLRAYLSSRKENEMGLLFATSKGTPHDRAHFVRYKLWPLLDALKIPRCGMKAFRHTNGSLMDRLKAPIKIRQQRLGHAQGSKLTLDIYTHVIGDDDRTIAGELGTILDPFRTQLEVAQS